MAQCENCGANLKPNAARCVKCGSVVTARAEPVQPSAGPAPGDPTTSREVNVNVHIQPTGFAGAQGGSAPSAQQPQPPGCAGPQQDYGQPTPGYAATPLVPKPNRGATILVMAIMSYLCAPLLPALVAWKMANTDLREIRAGVKDPSGQGLIQFGKVLCIINVALSVLLLLLLLINAANS